MINFCPPGSPITARRALKNMLQTRRVNQSRVRRFFYSPRCNTSDPGTSDAPGNLLALGPSRADWVLIGYARVSTSGQLLDRQQHALAI